MTAAEAGASVVVVEKALKIGGVTALSGGQVWIGANHLQARCGIGDSPDEVASYLEFLSGGFGEGELRDVYVEQGPLILRTMMERFGIPFEIIREFPDYYCPKAPGSKEEGRYLETAPFEVELLGNWASRTLAGQYPVTTSERVSAGPNASELGRMARGHELAGERCAGGALAGHFLKAAFDRGVEFRTESRATKLVTEDERVVGVEVSAPGGTACLGARSGVVLATGGYDWNPEFMRSYEQLLDYGSMAPNTVEGDHIVMAGEVGALTVLARPALTNPVLFGYALKNDEGEAVYTNLYTGWPHSIVVNRYGNRFADDSFQPDVVAGLGQFGNRNQGFLNWPAWLVFDQAFRDKYPLGRFAPGSELPPGLATVASTLGDLAEMSGIEEAGLAATVERFNGFCESGIDEDFGRGTYTYSRKRVGDPRLLPGNPNLGRLAAPPFYAVRLVRIGMGIPSAGLKSDKVGRVIGARGGIIPGLYAVGNSAAQRDIGAGYNSGISNARGMIYGYLAAQTIVSVA